MRKYALVNNSIVTAIVDLEDNEVLEQIQINHSVIDVTDMSPQPQVNYVLNGNVLELPQNLSSREALEIDLALRKLDFGANLSRNSIARIAARNKILNKSNEQVATLLNQLLSVKMLLDTGALGTARLSCMQLKLAYTEYTDIFDYVISEVNSFESQFGL
jgi:hypothetical protein